MKRAPRPFILGLSALVLGALSTGVSSVVDPPSEGTLTSSDGAPEDLFGFSVAIDGDTAIVGAPRNGAGGSAYVFVWDGEKWIEQAKLTPRDHAAGQRLGWGVGIDGDRAVVSAISDSHAGVDSGSAYVFRRRGTNWVQEAKLIADDAGLTDRFGWSLAIEDDIVVVGATQFRKPGPGAVFIFQRSGTSWRQLAKLRPGDAATGDQFGYGVAIDGNVVIGVARDKDNFRGAAYVFRRRGNNWVQEAKLDADEGDGFGGEVSVRGDTAVLSAYGAYVFERRASGREGGVPSADDWTQVAKLTGSDILEEDVWFDTVAIEGETILVGVSRDDDWGGLSGSAYLFEPIQGVWSETGKITSADTSFRSQFGWSIAFHETTILIGAKEENIGKPGTAYTFGLTPEQRIVFLEVRVSNLVRDGTLSAKAGKGLLARLKRAKRLLGKGKVERAKKQLEKFTKKVPSFVRRGVLSPALGQALIDSADITIAELDKN